MVETRIRTRPILSNWLLLTYDLPHTPAGDKARRRFLAGAEHIGAVQHTQSVYLLPWTDESLKLAAGVAEVGHAYLWTTKMEDREYAREVTRTYDKKIKPRFDQIGERIGRIEGHVGKHPKTAQKMAVRTQNMLDDLEAAVIRRRSNELYKMVLKLRKRLEVL